MASVACEAEHTLFRSTGTLRNSTSVRFVFCVARVPFLLRFVIIILVLFRFSFQSKLVDLTVAPGIV